MFSLCSLYVLLTAWGQESQNIDRTTRLCRDGKRTNFTFLHGASHPYELVATSAAMGLSGVGICDHDSLAGVVRAYASCEIKADFFTF
ncbi:hypothetical protein ABIB57_005259 [Devosia sp. UYZn731]